MWECEWEKEKHHPTIHSFLETHLSVLRPFQGCQEISEKDILTTVKNGFFFGLVQCDVEVPAHLREYFSEMQPIFKNCAVSREDTGDFMKDYAKEHKLLSQPRQTLISSFSAQGILLTTPLLQWYLSHGLKVTNIQQTVEYKPQKCFQNFGEKVSNARRQGDTDLSKAVLADTFKLLGNSAYGKTITNAKHNNVIYADHKTCQKLINDPHFRKLTPMTADVDEVELSKSKLKWNLPLQIGFFCLPIRQTEDVAVPF